MPIIATEVLQEKDDLVYRVLRWKEDAGIYRPLVQMQELHVSGNAKYGCKTLYRERVDKIPYEISDDLWCVILEKAQAWETVLRIPLFVPEPVRYAGLLFYAIEDKFGDAQLLVLDEAGSIVYHDTNGHMNADDCSFKSEKYQLSVSREVMAEIMQRQ